MKTLQEELGGTSLFEAARALGVRFQKEALPEDKFVTVGGMGLHYLDWGVEGKPQVLLLHGGAQTAHSWDFFSMATRDDYHVVAMDQRGHGDSAWSEEGDYSIEAHCRDIDGLTDAIGFQRFYLIGLSMGGRNAYGFAARNPGKVRALVIVDVGPEIQQGGRKRIQEFLKDAETFDSLEWLVERVRRYSPWRSEAQIRGSLAHNLKRTLDGRWTWKYDRRRWGQPRGTPEGPEDPWEDVRALRCPTLIVRGANSDIFSPETARKMLDAIPQSQLVTVSRAGHLVQGDNPLEFEQAVRGFLAGCGA